MTALNDRTTLLASFAVFAVTQVTWPETARTDKKVRAGATTVVLWEDALPAGLVVETVWTANTRYVCPEHYFLGQDANMVVQQLMQELGGGSSSGGAPARIEAGPGSYNNGSNDAKPWQRGPTGGPAPWRSRNQDSNNEGGSSAPWARDRNRGNDNQEGDNYYGGGQNYNGSATAGSAPWSQAPGTQGGYPGYPGYSAYGAAPGMGAPPGLASPPGAPGLGAPPGLPGGLNALIQQYASGSVPPPPPPADGAPPPPPSDQPPPPPPGA
jgi:splicing factor 1